MRLLSALLFSTAFLFAQVPTPESVLGHKPGDDFYLASYDESLGYFQKLAASTDKLKLVQVGKTTQGRDWYIAIISSAKNLADLDKYKDTAKRLALVKGLNDAEAHALARNGKVIVHIDGGLHATEVAGAQHTIQLAYNLVTGRRRDHRDPRQRDPAAVVLHQSRRPEHGGALVPQQSGDALRSEQHAGAVAGIHRPRQQSRRLHEQHDRSRR